MRYVVFCLLLLSKAAFSTTYYVSFSSGNDANNGTSTATAWKYHPWDANAATAVKNTVLAAGDVVVMKGGDTWYDCQLTPDNAGSAGNVITTKTDGVWGSGPAVLSGAVDPASLNWTNVGGGVYSAPLTTQTYVVVYNGTMLAENTGTPTAPSAGQFGWSTNVLYVNIDGATAPSAGTLLAANRTYVIADGTNYIRFEGLTAEAGNNNNAALGIVQQLSRTGVEFVGLTVRWFKYYGLYQFTQTSGVTNYNIVYNNNNGTRGIYINGGSNAVVTGNVIYNVGSSGAYPLGITNISSSTFTSNIIRDNLGWGVQINGSSSTNTFKNNTILRNGSGYYPSGSGGGMQIGPVAGDTVSGNLIINNEFRDNYQHLYAAANAGTGGNKIIRNLFVNATVNGIKYTDDPNTNATQFIGNIFIHSPSASNNSPYTGHSLEYGGEKAIITNNVFVLMAPSSAAQGIAINTNYTDIRIDNNLFYNASGGTTGFAKVGSTVYSTLATWKAAASADTKIVDLSGNSSTAESSSQECTKPGCYYDGAWVGEFLGTANGGKRSVVGVVSGGKGIYR